jgi:hypothetical protein
MRNNVHIFDLLEYSEFIKSGYSMANQELVLTYFIKPALWTKVNGMLFSIF